MCDAGVSCDTRCDTGDAATAEGGGATFSQVSAQCVAKSELFIKLSIEICKVLLFLNYTQLHITSLKNNQFQYFTCHFLPRLHQNSY